MKIWIDLVNAPHVLFFKNIIDYLRNEGEDVLITTRQFGDTIKLLDLFGEEYISVGGHGVTLQQKLTESTSRLNKLSKIIIKEKPDVSVAKHSIELPRISFGLGIPSVYAIDNEHATAVNKITLPLCDTIIVPKAISMWKILQFGADPDNIIRYNGTSEIVHFKNFKYNENIFEELDLNIEKEKTILMRPEPSLASYLDADCRKSILSPIVENLEEHANILVIPRFKEQQKLFEDDPDVTLIKPPVDTFSLMKKSDLVIGAGGTMNREAALLGTPVISCYPGETLAVDKYYVDRGLMKRSNNLDEIIDISLDLLKNHGDVREIETDDLFDLIIKNIYESAGV